VHNVFGRTKLVEDSLLKALYLYDEIGDRRNMSFVNFNLGTLNFVKGCYVDAKKYYEKAINLCRETNNIYVESSALGYLGGTMQVVGLYDKAKTLFDAALQLNRKVGNRNEEKYTLSNLTELHLHLKDYPQAKEFAQSALQLSRELKDEYIESNTQVLLGHIHMELEEYQLAESAYQAAFNLRSNGQKKLQLESLAGLAMANLAQNKQVEALQNASIVLEIAMDITDIQGTPSILKAYLDCYQVFSQQQDTRGEQLLTKAYGLLQNALEKIPDEEMGYAFLNNVEVNKQIMEAYKEE